MLTSPLPPSLLGRYNRSTFDLGCSPPYMVKIFLFFWSISFPSSFVHSVIPTLYQTASTTNVFIAWNTCFEFNFHFHIAFNLHIVFFHIFLTYIPFLQNAKYLYPSSPILPISSPFSSSIPLHSTSFPLFIAKKPHLSILNFIPMSFVTISTVLKNLSISFGCSHKASGCS